MPQIDGNFLDELLYVALVFIYLFDDNEIEDFVLLFSLVSAFNVYLHKKTANYPLEFAFFSALQQKTTSQ